MKDFNIGILGTGKIAVKMSETLSKMNGVCCFAIASRSQEKADIFAKEYNFKKSYGSYKALLNDSEVDLVYIATPHSEHFLNAKMCIESGKPCLVEKAFTVNAKQARLLFQLAAEKKVFITEAIWVRYMPFVKTIKEVLSSGVIGKPTMLTGNLGYRICQNKRIIDPSLAGGALLDVGVYTLNFASIFFGNDIEKVVSTCTFTSTGVDEQNSITLVYKDGRVAVLNSSMLSLSDRYGFIHGEKGYIQIENINNFQNLKVCDQSGNILAEYKCPPQISGYEYEVLACIKAIQEGKIETPDMPHQESITIMELMDSIRHSWNLVYPCE